MKLLLLLVLTFASVIDAANESARFEFMDAGYFHRWSGDDQHEFTPAQQENLEKWADMITLNSYPSVNEGEGLAKTANAVLENYKQHQGKVLRTDSLPATAEKPAEHFIAVVFGRPDFLEVAFARFKIIDGVGVSIVYSHRIYGEKAGDRMSEWLSAHGPATEKALLDWKAAPSPKGWRKEFAPTKT